MAAHGSYAPLPTAADGAVAPPSPGVYSPTDQVRFLEDLERDGTGDGVDVEEIDKGLVDESAVVVPGEDE